MSYLQKIIKERKPKKAPKEKKTERNWLEITPDHVELAVAWANDEVKLAEVSKVLGYEHSSNQSYIFLARSLKEYVKGISDSDY